MRLLKLADCRPFLRGRVRSASASRPSAIRHLARAGHGFIQWLQSSNIFLVALDHEGVWFRFHHLFLQMLRDRMNAVLPADEVRRLRRKQQPGWQPRAIRKMRCSCSFKRAIWIPQQDVVGEARRT